MKGLSAWLDENMLTALMRPVAGPELPLSAVALNSLAQMPMNVKDRFNVQQWRCPQSCRIHQWLLLCGAGKGPGHRQPGHLPHPGQPGAEAAEAHLPRPWPHQSWAPKLFPLINACWTAGPGRLGSTLPDHVSSMLLQCAHAHFDKKLWLCYSVHVVAMPHRAGAV